jgi:hypothetical protein
MYYLKMKRLQQNELILINHRRFSLLKPMDEPDPDNINAGISECGIQRGVAPE